MAVIRIGENLMTGGNNAQGFNTADDCAAAAIDLINPQSIAQNIEFAGRIFQRAGKYFFTPAITQNLRDESSPPPRLAGVLNVGTYHTHSGKFDETDESFSPKDMLKANMAN